MWRCRCNYELEDDTVCSMCGEGLDVEDEDTDKQELEDVLDKIEILVRRARKLLK